MRKNNLFRACCGKEVSHHLRHLAETQMQAEWDRITGYKRTALEVLQLEISTMDKLEVS